MKQRVAAILVTVASTGLVFAQQPSVPKTGMETDLPEVVAEVRASRCAQPTVINKSKEGSAQWGCSHLGCNLR